VKGLTDVRYVRVPKRHCAIQGLTRNLAPRQRTAGRARGEVRGCTAARDPGPVYLKTDPLLDPLRKEPRFQAIERELKFPN
jgi:hypothetical protein